MVAATTAQRALGVDRWDCHHARPCYSPHYARSEPRDRSSTCFHRCLRLDRLAPLRSPRGPGLRWLGRGQREPQLHASTQASLHGSPLTDSGSAVGRWEHRSCHLEARHARLQLCRLLVCIS